MYTILVFLSAIGSKLSFGEVTHQIYDHKLRFMAWIYYHKADNLPLQMTILSTVIAKLE